MKQRLRQRLELTAHHRAEAERIQRELDVLGPEFAEDGIVRWVLRERIEQEKLRVHSAMASAPAS